MIIVFNNIKLSKFYTLDYFLMATAALHLTFMLAEYCYFKFYRNKAINLDLRVKFTFLMRFKDYTRVFVVAAVFGVVVICSGYFAAKV
jgi:hypothetical protein